MRRTLVITALLAGVIALSGCTGMFGSGTGSDIGTVAPEQGGTGEPAPGTAPDVAPGTPAEIDANRQVISTGSVTVIADDPIAAGAEATSIVESAGGRVDSRTERAPTDTDPGSATLTLRIPAANLSDVLEELTALGDSREVSLAANDVTVVTQDLDARILALRASVDRLLALLSTATDTSTLVELETALSERQGELESLEAQRRYYADQVALATITLNLLSEAQAQPETPGTFWSGLAVGWDALVGFFAGLLVAFGVLLPWLGLAALLAAAAIFIVRAVRRRKVTTSTPAPTPEV